MIWHGQFEGKEKVPTIVLEAFCDHHLWIWHASFGHAVTLNNINIWERGPLLRSFVEGSFSELVDFEFQIGGKKFNKLWLLVNGIYPEIGRFVTTIEEPIGA
jgi:Plant transposon protein